jgi:hypothetical protein
VTGALASALTPIVTVTASRTAGAGAAREASAAPEGGRGGRTILTCPGWIWDFRVGLEYTNTAVTCYFS